MKQKYFYHEHLANYAELKAKGLLSRGELYGNPNDFSLTKMPCGIAIRKYATLHFSRTLLAPVSALKTMRGTICVDGVWYIHQRRYRSPENLRLELERHGFTVLEQSGEVTENASRNGQTRS